MIRLIAISAFTSVVMLGQGFSVGTDGPDKTVAIQGGGPVTFGAAGVTGAIAGPDATIAGAPYSAQATTERVQILADGNRIQQTSSGNVARDSRGRIRHEEDLPAVSGGQEPPHFVNIEDPVAGVHWTLDPQTKTAFKMQFIQMKLPAKTAPGPLAAPPPIGPEKTWFFTASPSPANSVQILSKTLLPPDTNASKTDLGTQTIEGVSAHGTRTTRTIPAGAVGNEQPIVITTETWYSPDLKVLVMSKTEDPRMGETTYKLSNILRAEPPADLFQVPDDYTIKDKPSNGFFMQKRDDK
jgi:hypothetical protein